jgi:amino-acid N-acetyltransferase
MATGAAPRKGILSDRMSAARRAQKRSWTIRAAGFEDAEPIFALVKRNPQELVPRPVSDIVQNIDRFLVCGDPPDLLGIVSWQILPEIGAARHPTVEIKSLAVRKDHRGQGIGRALVATAIAHIRTLHPAQLIVLTFHPEFFRKLGFREVRKETLMHKIYIGCINCAKYDSPFTCPEVAMSLTLRERD